MMALTDVSDSRDAEPNGHVPVLVPDVIRFLRPGVARVLVDGTVGLGGHTEALLAASADVQVVGIDRDESALQRARSRLARFGARVRLVHGDYAELAAHLDRLGIGPIDGFLLDLGVSSLQLDDGKRGFSFKMDGPLDMRMNRSAGIPAADWLRGVTVGELERVLREYGEERYAHRIARAIVQTGREEPIATTGDLRRVVHRAVPGAYFAQRIDPATRTFQAIRIAVNAELDQLERGLRAGFSRLHPGGTLVAISFHSLEDRMVKLFMRHLASECVCPPDLPQCVCGKQVEAEVLTRKPVAPSVDEASANPRARSAKLRACRKVL